MTLSASIPLEERAARLWPDDPRNQAEWLRAVGVVRATKRGWELDKPVVPKRRKGRAKASTLSNF